MSKDILTALRHPAAGLGAAGFVDVEQAVLECPISDEISWRCAIVREPDEDPWFGEIMVGIWVPDLRPTLRFGWPKRCDPGIYTRNLFDLADSRGRSVGSGYYGSRFRRGGFFRVRGDEEVEALVAADLGKMIGRVAIPWFDRLRTVSAAAENMDTWLTSLPSGKAPIDWAHLGALWRYAGDTGRAARAWRTSASMGREYARYADHLRSCLENM
ncbi:MAG: hypothetical protein IPL36_11225 [Nigerium sp.]|nr:hypothetical protein [Nigerium sp.]